MSKIDKIRDCVKAFAVLKVWPTAKQAVEWLAANGHAGAMSDKMVGVCLSELKNPELAKTRKAVYRMKHTAIGVLRLADIERKLDLILELLKGKTDETPETANDDCVTPPEQNQSVPPG